MGIWFGQVGSCGRIQSNLSSKHLGTTLQWDISICIVQLCCWPKRSGLSVNAGLSGLHHTERRCWCSPFKAAALGAHTGLVWSSSLTAKKKNSIQSQHTHKYTDSPPDAARNTLPFRLVNFSTKQTFLHPSAKRPSSSTARLFIDL